MRYTDEEQQNIELIRGLYRDVLGPMDSSKVDDYIVEDYIQHSPLAESGREPLKVFLDFIQGESPDAVHDLKRLFADGDMVISHTHVNRFPGDTGLAVADFFRIENNKIVEHWDVIQEIAEPAHVAKMF